VSAGDPRLPGRAVKGLDLAERFYEECGRPLIARAYPASADRIAGGLVGEGSECFGFDDELSRDHDWGPGFCLWLRADDHAEIGAGLQALYDDLPRSYAGFRRPDPGPHAGKRTGVFEITDFYRRFMRYDHVPATLAEWRALPETYLATATNGRVFADPLGDFTAFRQGLLAFYPEDLRLKKIAARCAAAGQSGQYNYPRSIARGEPVAAHVALSTFVEAVISLVYLLNKRYRPFYKWMHRGMKELPVLGERCHDLLAELCGDAPEPGSEGAWSARRQEWVEEIGALLVAELAVEGLSDSPSDFLMDHAHAVQEKIENQALRSLPVTME
jgi:hypothetical protein